MDARNDAHILLVDDEVLASRMFAFIIEEAELGEALQCGDSREVIGILRSRPVDVVLLDLSMPHMSGLEVLELINASFPDIPVVILTNEDRLEIAVDCMKMGAFDFITKPVERNRLVSAIRHALTIRELRREVNILATRREERPLQNPEAFSAIVTQSSAMRTIFAYIEAVAHSPKAVLITGESGTGKELIAQVIHNLSGRDGRYVAINVSGLDDTVFSDSLFGHLRGSYTGAEGIRKGLVEQAKDGTLFMDEIGDMETGPQIKLLRLLQEGEYYPLGSDSSQKSRARIVAATNADLHGKQENGSFRKDLYYRLIAHRIELPALRERREDIALLLEHFVADAARTLSRKAPKIPAELLGLLHRYNFPGNIRELQAIAFDAVSRTNGNMLAAAWIEAYVRDRQPDISAMAGIGSVTAIEPRDTQPPPSTNVAVLQEGREPANGGFNTGPESESMQNTASGPDGESAIQGPGDFWLGRTLPKLQDVEDFLFSQALHRSGGNQSMAAQLLGISQSTLSRWLRAKQQVE